MLTAEHVVIESHLDRSNDNNADLYDSDISNDNKNPMSPINDNILENKSTHSNFKLSGFAVKKEVMHKEEQKFKEADIIKKSYLKLNQPIDANDNLHYTYFNLIIDCTFADLNTEKNSIAFEIAVALNYLDSSKGISIVLSEVAECINHIFEKIQVLEHEEL
ncbi:944_t:CDS:2 [Cetraspora pellucida]|uniref:944_t:CDS:1 n=1 Tax=Cetraspora pellucida TaxID=1433469 RepID=A0A9N9GSE4_9GLOM|nr:944_t:CDS:2 [Cetraspora pellucida]